MIFTGLWAWSSPFGLHEDTHASAVRSHLGYVFPTSASISPHLEHPRTGPTSVFCAELASRLRCYVAAGYPERLKSHEVESGADEIGSATERIGANSAVIYGPDGEWVGGYRKTNLFHTDQSWAKPGTLHLWTGMYSLNRHC